MVDVHATGRLPVTYVPEAGEYAIRPPTEFEGAHKVNVAVTRFYRPGAEEPFDSYELTFADGGVPDSDGLLLGEAGFEDCEYEMVFGYAPAYGLPHEVVDEAVTELEAVEEFDGRFCTVGVSYDRERMRTVDYCSIDVRASGSETYVAGDVYRVDDPGDRAEGERELLFASRHQWFPGEYAGHTAEITYYRDRDTG